MIKKLLLLFMAFISANSMAEIVVIANANNKLKNIETNVLQDIYMGRKHAFEDGGMVLPIDQEKLRADFYQHLTNRPIEQIDAYWARIVFSGEAYPPRVMPDDASVISTVKKNSGAIGYVSKESTTKGVKTLLILK